MDQRGAHRFPADLDAECRTLGCAWRSRLRNISTSGCMIECPDELAVEGMLRLRIKGVPAIDGRIAWRHRGHAGVRFTEPLPAAIMLQLGFPLPDPAPYPVSSAA